MALDFNFSEEQKMLIASAERVAKDFPPEYWREKDQKHEFGREFWDAIAKAGFFGIIIPQEYGGAGLGSLEFEIVQKTLCESGVGMAGSWYLLISEGFGGLSITKFGTEEQKKKFLPKIASGEECWCMAMTEPDAGVNTLNTATTCVRDGDWWVINGSKQFITLADIAQHTMVITRTTPIEKAKKKTLGISLVLGDLPDPHVMISPIPKMGENWCHTNAMGFDDYRVPADYMMVEDTGFYALLNVLDIERLSCTAGPIGCAKLSIRKAVEYAMTRKLFGDTPIAAYQGLQHPLAFDWAELECAEWLMYKAATMFDAGENIVEVGKYANMAKVVAVETAIKACHDAMQCFGGSGYIIDMDVERWLRETLLIRMGPVPRENALNFIAENVLGMPRSY